MIEESEKNMEIEAIWILIAKLSIYAFVVWIYKVMAFVGVYIDIFCKRKETVKVKKPFAMSIRSNFYFKKEIGYTGKMLYQN